MTIVVSINKFFHSMVVEVFTEVSLLTSFGKTLYSTFELEVVEFT